MATHLRGTDALPLARLNLATIVTPKVPLHVLFVHQTALPVQAFNVGAAVWDTYTSTPAASKATSAVTSY